MNKPFSQACENNKEPILEILNQYLSGNEQILEVGSGTGQHAHYFANHLPQVSWQTSDLPANHEGINAWIKECGFNNVQPPLALNVADPAQWPNTQYDAVFTANTTHIMSWQEVTCLFKLVGSCLKSKGLFFCYGPFNLNGQFTSDSNERFDTSLRCQNPQMGIRDLNDIQQEARKNQLAFIQRHAMPANNMLLVFSRR